MSKNKIISVEEMKNISRSYKERGIKIISTSGCFDILHAGHVTYLEEAKKFGDKLLIMLNSDLSVRNLKGEERPIVTEKERAIVIAGLEAVDYVVLFDDLTPCRLIEEIEPDIVIKGGDYEGVHIPEMDVVSKYGGIVKYVSMVKGCSSTNIIEKIKELSRKEEL